MVKKSSSLKKNNIYMVVITEEMGVRDILSKAGILSDDEERIGLILE